MPAARQRSRSPSMVSAADALASAGRDLVTLPEDPPPGLRVIRDTPIVTGERAVSRGRLLILLALGCGIASAALAVLLWRFGLLLGSHAVSADHPQASLVDPRRCAPRRGPTAN